MSWGVLFRLLVLFKAPLMVILLTVVMLQAGTELTALIILAVAVVLVVLPHAMAALGRLQTAPGKGAPSRS